MPSANTIDASRLAEEIERYVAQEGNLLTNLEFESGVPTRTIYAIRKGARDIEIDTADRLCLALQIPLSDVLPFDAVAPSQEDGWCRSCREQVGLTITNACPWCGTDVLPGARRGPQLDRNLRCISAEMLAFAYRLYGAGHSLRETAAIVQPRTTYKTESACANSLYDAFRARGWKLRSQRDVTVARNTRHGRSTRAKAALRKGDPGWEEYAAYRNEQKRANGEIRDVRCEAVTKNGSPCKRWALDGKTFCIAHDPENAERVAQRLEQTRAKARAKQAPWSTISDEVASAIERHGRPALTRAVGVSPTVMGRMLRYAPDQLIRKDTVRRFRLAIAQLNLNKEHAA